METGTRSSGESGSDSTTSVRQKKRSIPASSPTVTPGGGRPRPGPARRCSGSGRRSRSPAGPGRRRAEAPPELARAARGRAGGARNFGRGRISGPASPGSIARRRCRSEGRPRRRRRRQTRRLPRGGAPRRRRRGGSSSRPQIPGRERGGGPSRLRSVGARPVPCHSPWTCLERYSPTARLTPSAPGPCNWATAIRMAQRNSQVATMAREKFVTPANS